MYTDEHTIGFQGRYKKKPNTIEKEMGLWLTAIVIMINSFHFRNISTLMNHMRLKLSTFYSRVLGIFDTSPDSNHKNWVDNLHAYFNCVAQSLKHFVHLTLEGSRRKDGLGSPEMCKKEEVKGCDIIREAIGTIK